MKLKKFLVSYFFSSPFETFATKLIAKVIERKQNEINENFAFLKVIKNLTNLHCEDS